MTRETGFHPQTSELTRSFAEYKGFWLPASYTRNGASPQPRVRLICLAAAMVRAPLAAI